MVSECWCRTHPKKSRKKYIDVLFYGQNALIDAIPPDAHLQHVYAHQGENEVLEIVVGGNVVAQSPKPILTRWRQRRLHGHSKSEFATLLGTLPCHGPNRKATAIISTFSGFLSGRVGNLANPPFGTPVKEGKAQPPSTPSGQY